MVGALVKVFTVLSSVTGLLSIATYYGILSNGQVFNLNGTELGLLAFIFALLAVLSYIRE